MTEDEIIQQVVSKWVGLGLEFARGASGVTTMYIYVSSEDGSRTGNVYFEQDGKVDFPERLAGAEQGPGRLRALQAALLTDLREAETEFAAAGVPAPTEYRIRYDMFTEGVEAEFSREEKFGPDSELLPEEDGIVIWLGDRAPRLV